MSQQTNRERFQDDGYAVISKGLDVYKTPLALIDISNFDHQDLLRRDTQNGAWLYSYLVRTYPLTTFCPLRLANR